MEFFKTHTNKNRENEWELFMAKVKYALRKIGDKYHDELTYEPVGFNGKTMKQILNETGKFSYNSKEIGYDFEFDRCVYAYVED
jgi:hypothetical protein